MSKTIKKYSKTAIVLGLILAILGMYGLIPTGQAASTTSRKDTLSDSRPATLSNHTIQFVTPTGVDANTDTIILTFDSSPAFVMGTFALLNFDLAVDTTGPIGDCGSFVTEKTLAVAAAAGVWGVGQSGQVVTFTAPTDAGATEIAAGSCVQIEIGSNATAGGGGSTQITNPTKVAGSGTADIDEIDITGAFNDTGKILVATIEGVTVSATIAESLSVIISDTAIGFGTLTSTAVRYATADETGNASEPSDDAPTYLQVTTNATSGVGITIKDVGDGSANAGLYKSTATANLIAAVVANSDTPVAGTEGYAVYGKGAGSGITIDEGFDNDNTSPVAITRSPLAFASSTGPLNAINVDISAKAAISGITDAGSYSDTLILITTPTY